MKRINCDVFMKEGTTLDLINQVICITGNFYAGKNCSVSTAIIAGGSVVFEDLADTVGIYAEGTVSIGDFSDVLSISSNQSISLGDYCSANAIVANEDVSLGYKTYAVNITAYGDVTADKHCKLRTFFKKLFLDLKRW